MTIVCPKCMHKAADDDHVCERCGGALAGASERRPVVSSTAGVDSSNSTSSRSSRRVSRSGVATFDKQQVAGNGDSAADIREALEYLEAANQNKPMARIEYSDDDARPKVEPRRKVNRTWLTTIIVTVVAAIALSLFFGLSGSSSPSTVTKGTNGSVPAQTPTLLFQFAGTGTKTTGSFTASGAFKFAYRVSCQTAIAAPATFSLLRSGVKVGEVVSGSGATSESGSEKSFGVAGSFTLSIDAPPSCSWSVAGTS